MSSNKSVIHKSSYYLELIKKEHIERQKNGNIPNNKNLRLMFQCTKPLKDTFTIDSLLLNLNIVK